MSVMRGGSAGSIFVGILICVVALSALYYIYSWLNTSSPLTSVPLVGTAAMNKTVPLGKTTAVSAVDLSGVNASTPYSASFWVYVASTAGSGADGNLINLMEINTKKVTDNGNREGKTIVYVGLNPVNATLVVRQGTNDENSKIDSTTDNSTASKYTLHSLITGYNGDSIDFKANNRCDIVNGIEYQRWVLISVVSNGRVFDVYIDGKLARSCAYSAGNVGSANGDAYAYFGLKNDAETIKGYYSNGNFYNYSLTPANVWSMYQNGPGAPFNLVDWISSFFTISVSVNGLPPGVCPSCPSN